MNDHELEQLLKTWKVPGRSPQYYRAFPKKVTKLNMEQGKSVPVQSSLVGKKRPKELVRKMADELKTT